MKLGPLSLNRKNLELTIPYNQHASRTTDITKAFIRWALLVLTLISVAAWIFYFRADLTLSYNDARSHLNIARRVIDNLQPGFAQLGSVWLPLYHILELPLIANDTLWHTGIAGSVVSMAAYIAGGIYLLLIAKELGFDKFSSTLAVAIYALNPNLLFMQTTPMTESLLLFLSSASIYYLLKWVKRFQMSDLIGSAFFTFLATLTRYDGWFLLLFVFLTVIVVGFKKHGKKFAEGNLFLFATLAGFGVVIWFCWNFLIFGDPLFFATGDFSAKAQQDVLQAEGRLFSKGNLVYSTYLYALAVMHNGGSWLSLLAVVGYAYFLMSKKISKSLKLAASLLFVPVVFNIASLVAGHSVIHLPTLPPYTWFNDRYGLMVLPALALFVAFLAHKRKLAAILISAIIALEITLTYATNSIITIEDGVRGASGQYLDDASGWIAQNVDDGLILVAASSNDALLFKSGLPLKQFITEGAKKEWTESMIDPTIHAKWVIMHKNDLVYESMFANPNFLANYSLVYKDSFSYIYTYNPTGGGVSETQLPQ